MKFFIGYACRTFQTTLVGLSISGISSLFWFRFKYFIKSINFSTALPFVTGDFAKNVHSVFLCVVSPAPDPSHFNRYLTLDLTSIFSLFQFSLYGFIGSLYFTTNNPHPMPIAPNQASFGSKHSGWRVNNYKFIF